MVRRGAALALLGLVTACGDVIVDGGFCVAWTDGGPTPASPPESLACEVLTKVPDAGVIPASCSDPAWCGVELRYVCVDAVGGACPSPGAAKERYGSCLKLDTQHGEGCDAPLSGACTTRKAWSACGPDPAASGGCCYYVYVVESTVLS